MSKQTIKFARQRASQFHAKRVYWYTYGTVVTRRAGSYIKGV